MFQKTIFAQISVVSITKIVFCSFVFVSLSCNNGSGEKKIPSSVVVRSAIEASFIGGNSNYRIGDTAALRVSLKDSLKNLEGIEVYLNDVLYSTEKSFPFNISIATTDLKTGRNAVRISALTTNKIETKTTSFTLFAPNKPKMLTYRILAVYDHDKMAYTQGLFFHEGKLYEGTGQKKISSLRLVDLESGNIERLQKMDGSLFGEGIAYFEGQIYQLTWVSQVGFVYNASDFEVNRKVYYSGEGWGLTSDSTFLIRSDGTNVLSFHDPANFSLERRLEVYTNEGPLEKLNELEYINGKIYANVYQSDYVAIIDPNNGVVESMLDLKGILQKKYRTKQTDVLNGIAYDAVGKRIFVTGKYWAKLFEISIEEPPEIKNGI